ncbi:MAG: Ig-like domain-containing protein [Chthoniobacter sp.]|uniref:Ig-like domain-containing protein n=1 Tax=Chthoniobacter sp. TaxID=2510640 RepID=UPI0032A3E525
MDQLLGSRPPGSNTVLLRAAELDTDHNGLPDDWERFYFGSGYGSAGGEQHLHGNDLAPAGNGLTILQCYQQGLDPNDYYKGQAPVLGIVGGDSQFGAPNTQLPQALVVEVRDQAGNLLHSAPVNFAITAGDGQLFPSFGRTDGNGRVSVTFTTSPDIGAASVVTATAGSIPHQASVAFHVGNQQPPTPPSGVTVVQNADGSIDMTWADNSDNETDFAIQLRNAFGEWETIGSVPANTTSVHINPDRTIAQ